MCAIEEKPDSGHRGDFGAAGCGAYRTTPAFARGLALNDHDRVSGYIIERLMCDFAIRFDDLVQRFGVLALPLISEAYGIAAAEHAELCWVDDFGLHMFKTRDLWCASSLRNLMPGWYPPSSFIPKWFKRPLLF
jgi:hypothetical protein